MSVCINFDKILETSDRDTVNELISQILDAYHFIEQTIARGRGISVDYLGENIGKITEIKFERY